MLLNNTLLWDFRQNLSAYLPISYGYDIDAIGHTVHLLILIQSPPKKLLDQVRDAIRLLRLPHRRNLRAVNSPLHSVSQQAPPKEDGQS